MKQLVNLSFLILVRSVLAQDVTVSNLSLSESGEVSFNFQISAKSSAREVYDIIIYSSKDNYTNPLDVQLNSLSPQVDYSVKFDGLEKIGPFDGVLQFKLKAVATLFPVRVEEMENTKLKRGKSVLVSWNDYHESGWYNVDLYQNGEVKANLISNHRGLSYESELPKDLEKGGYEIRVVPSNDERLQSDGYPIVIKGASKALFILGPLVAAGGGFMILNGGESGEAQLPNSPGPPEN